MISFVIKKRGRVLDQKEFSQDEILIGRKPSSDIHFNYPLVSREHANIVLDSVGYKLVDSSSQGTLVNDEVVQESVKRINEGDIIEIKPFSIEVLSIKLKVDTSSAASSESAEDEESPFSDEAMEDADVDTILGAGQKSDPNNLMHIALDEAKRNNKEAKLREIIQNDTRLIKYQKNEIIIREGDYGTTAFYLLKGSARVVIEKLSDEALKRKSPEPKSFMAAFNQLWSNSKEAEARDLSKSLHYDKDMSSTQDEVQEHHKVFLQDVPGILQNFQTHLLVQGEVFGEVSALSRSPRGATIYAEEDCFVVEMRWQALREIRRITPTFKEKIDENYRERCLKTHLLLTDLFKDLPSESIDEIVAKSEFFSYGNFEWHNDFKKITKESSEDRIKKEDIIVEEGNYVNGLFLIRAGFARVSRIENHGHFTHKYLGKGGVFGLDELIHNFNSEHRTSHKTSLRSIGYTEVIYIPSHLIFDLVFKKGANDPKDKQTKIEAMKNDSIQRLDVDQGMVEFLVENRIMNGTQTMFIDLDRCTRCDDCVTACSKGHNNNPRFIRHGKQYDHFMIANACMHCNDPVCMIGCPTGAINRNHIKGEVVIADDVCIGCSTCANSCPYENIRMVNIKDEKGNALYSTGTTKPMQKATKCDLCAEQLGGPACERACPHDALVRIDMSDVNKLKKFLNR